MITQPENQLCHYRVTGVNIKHDNQLRFIGISADVTDEIDSLTEASTLTDQINLVSNAGGVGLIELLVILSSKNNETPVLIENPLEGMRVLMA